MIVFVLSLKLNCWAIFRKKYWVSCLADKTTQLHRGRYGKGDHHCWELRATSPLLFTALARNLLDADFTESWNLPSFSCLCQPETYCNWVVSWETPLMGLFSWETEEISIRLYFEISTKLQDYCIFSDAYHIMFENRRKCLILQYCPCFVYKLGRVLVRISCWRSQLW